ncbi:MAG: MazG family protein [Clostridiales bacterium]|nr:MazG family protein [Clostridiales bacterium]
MKIIQELKSEKRHDFDSLRSVMAVLRGEGGCPWDREQTHASIRGCLIEETYEVVEAIDTDNPALLREELGDLLFQAVFHARIEEEQGAFDIDDVIHDITEKMIHRHPHVFSTVEAATSEAVLQNWDEIKKEEKQIESVTQSLRRIPPYLPALMRAQKIQDKARKKLSIGYLSSGEALSDAKRCISGESEDFAADLANTVFALCAAAQLEGIDLEAALTQRCDTFITEAERTEMAQ